VVYVDFQRNEALAKASTDGLRDVLLAGAGAPTCVPFSRVSLPDTAARMISAAYFTGKLSVLPDDSNYVLGGNLGSVQAMWATFQALPADVQQWRIIAMRQAFLTCQGNPLKALLPGAGR